MLFNSVAFFQFLALVYAGYLLLQLRRAWTWQNRWLLVASYVFYGAWDPRFLFLITASTVLDYSCGLVLERGSMTRAQMVRASGFLVAAALLFLGVDLDVLLASGARAWFAQPSLGAVTWSAPLWTAGACVVAFSLVRLASGLSERTRRRAFLWASLAGNLGILGFYKYFNFFLDSLGVPPETYRLDVVLPVGISFYTFQTLSYSIDVYRRQMPATDRLLDFALYVAFFPQLVAGPIERASRLLPRLLGPRLLAFEQISRGAYLILFGLFQKVAVADGVARCVDSVYARAPDGSIRSAGFADVCLGTLLFAIQIYCDFAGYSNIARGTAKLFGIELMTNFQRPYFSTNPSEFWRRWHISLSTWLRDYLYIPLGGNRGGASFSALHVALPLLVALGVSGAPERVGLSSGLVAGGGALLYGLWLALRRNMYSNLMLTMLLGGLWHGAAWNYVLWGLYQGLLLAYHRVASQLLGDVWAMRARLARILFPLRVVGFAVFVVYGWLLFRAVSVEQVRSFSTALLTGAGGLGSTMLTPRLSAIIGVPVLVCYELLEHRADDTLFYRRWPRPLRGALYASLLVLVLLGTVNEPAQFIYFQF